MTFRTRVLLSTVPLALLAGCGGESSSMIMPEAAPTLTYSYPADGQREVATRADLVLRFSAPVPQPVLVLEDTAAGTPLSHTLTPVDDGRSWVISPDQPLAPVQQYRLRLAEPLQAGDHQIDRLDHDGELVFTTRASSNTFRSMTATGSGFAVEQMMPDGDQYPVMDFSTLRLTLSQAIHPDAVVYGESVRLEDSTGNLVPAFVIARGRHLVIDPLAAPGADSDELTAGEQYTLILQDLPNLYGDELVSMARSFVPAESGPTEVLYQTATVNSSSQDLRSKLNGQPVNGIALSSVLLGNTPNSWQTGEMWAELAYSPNFPEMTPLRIPRGTLLSSTSLDVNVGGVVPLMTAAGVQQTGDIHVTMTTDAIGYLYRNPFSDADDAPRHVRLFMDVAMSTAEGQPNSALSQDLLGLELVGVAMIRNGTLEIDALSMVEPRLLGLEDAAAQLAFSIRAETVDRAQQNAPAPLADSRGPELLSWMPDETGSGVVAAHRPGDPVSLFFDEPVDPASARQGVRLLVDGEEPVEAVDVKVDGTTVTLQPAGGLDHGSHYTVAVSSALTDLAGNASREHNLNFTMPALASQTEASPLAVTTYPGFPCVTTGLDLVNHRHGRCTGTLDGYGNPHNGADDPMPVTELPANRPILVTFSQTMDLASIRLGETLRVERVTGLGNGSGSDVEAEPVPGRLELNHQKVRFYPDQPWQPGSFYRYTLVSEASASPDCGQAICSRAGQALETNALEGLSKRGGPDLTIYFRGGEASETVFLPLRNLPVRDVNADNVIQCGIVDETNSDGVVIRQRYARDCTEAPDVVFDGAGNPLTPPQATRVISPSRTDARVGCNRDRESLFHGWIETDCPELKFIYQTGALNTEVVGPVDPDNPAAGVRVLLHPTLLTTTSLTVNAKVLSDLTWAETPTGPQVIRMRYADDGQGNRTALIPGVIRTGEDGYPEFKTEVDLYLDAPDLHTPLGLPHNQHSIPLFLDLLGRVLFLEDGRQVIEQYNQLAQTIPVSVGGLVNFDLEIPVNGLRLTYLSPPVKELSGFAGTR